MIISSHLYMHSSNKKHLPKGYYESIFKVLLLKLYDLATASLICSLDIPSQPLTLQSWVYTATGDDKGFNEVGSGARLLYCLQTL